MYETFLTALIKAYEVMQSKRARGKVIVRVKPSPIPFPTITLPTTLVHDDVIRP